MVAKRVGAAVFTAAAVVAVAACQPGPGPGMPNQTAPPPQVSRAPASPPARICGNTSFLAGPASPPAGAIVVPAGDNTNVDFRRAGRTYWFAPGVHTLGSGEFSQIIPADNSTFIGGPGAILDGRDLNQYAFTQQARNVRIAHLTIRNFGRGPAANHQQGVVNHDAGDNWVIERNTVIANDGAGVFVGDGNVVRWNCLKDNGQYGFSVYEEDGVVNVTIDHNEVTGNNKDDWESRIDGCGCSGGAKFWETNGARATNNWVHGNNGPGLWADFNNRAFLFEGNYFEGNLDEALFYEVSYNATIRYNTFKRNTIHKGQAFAADGNNFPVAAVYISEAGGDARVAGPPIDRHPQQRLRGQLVRGHRLGERRPVLRQRGHAGLHARQSWGHPGDVPTAGHRLPPALRRLPVEEQQRAGPPQRLPGHPQQHRVLELLLQQAGGPVQLRHLALVLALPRRERSDRDHLQPEQPVLRQHLHRAVALHALRDRPGADVQPMACRAVQPGRLQQHQLNGGQPELGVPSRSSVYRRPGSGGAKAGSTLPALTTPGRYTRYMAMTRSAASPRLATAAPSRP